MIEASLSEVRPITLRNLCQVCRQSFPQDAVLVPEVGAVCSQCLLPGALEFLAASPPPLPLIPFCKMKNM